MVFVEGELRVVLAAEHIKHRLQYALELGRNRHRVRVAGLPDLAGLDDESLRLPGPVGNGKDQALITNGLVHDNVLDGAIVIEGNGELGTAHTGDASGYLDEILGGGRQFFDAGVDAALSQIKFGVAHSIRPGRDGRQFVNV